jgi:hypothetical protein
MVVSFEINHQKLHEEKIKLIPASRSSVRKNGCAAGQDNS